MLPFPSYCPKSTWEVHTLLFGQLTFRLGLYTPDAVRQYLCPDKYTHTQTGTLSLSLRLSLSLSAGGLEVTSKTQAGRRVLNEGCSAMNFPGQRQAAAGEDG